jgi:multicomponent Na+:H+ antiporter subunit E
MSSWLREQQQNMSRYLLLHLLIVAIVPFFVSFFGGILDYLIAFMVVGLLLAAINRRYGRYLFWSIVFIFYMIKEIIVSNIILAWLIIQPRPKLDPGIIEIPLRVTTPLEITVLSLAIAVTPGTMVVELAQDASGRNVLYVHSIDVRSPEHFRNSITEGPERMILRISKGATA